MPQIYLQNTNENHLRRNENLIKIRNALASLILQQIFSK